MFNYRNKYHHSPKKLSRLMIVGLIIFGVLCLSGAGSIWWYKAELKPPSASSQTIKFEVIPGQTPAQIADNLEAKGLIKNSLAFRLYLKINHLEGVLQAGDYLLSNDLTVQQIVDELSNGQIESRSFTILPSKRLDQLKESFSEAGFSDSEIAQAFDPANYLNHPISKYKPANASLEGYIYPETFYITDNTSAKEIVEKSLNEFYKHLTPDLVEKIEDQDLSVNEAIILASIVEQEVSNVSDKPTVAQVFLKRLRLGMQLGSDVTFFYAAAVYGGEPTPSLDNPYNTRLYSGLPPGPISNFDLSSLEAVAEPSNTDYLYFLAGDDGKTYFTDSFAEHNQNIIDHCQVNCLLPNQR